MAATSRQIFLTGSPGVGKTTAVRRTAEILRKKGVRLWGFITEGVSDDQARVGFRATTFDGGRVPFAHVLLKRGPRVGPYRVDVAAFEGAVLSHLDPPQTSKAKSLRSLGIVDEVGRMECLSRQFCDRVRQLLEAPASFLLTVADGDHGLVREIRDRAGEDLIEVTPGNRDVLPYVLAETFWLYLMK